MWTKDRVNFHMHPANTDELRRRSNLSNSVQIRIQKNQQWVRCNKSELSQRFRDFTWRRLYTRRSAARRPFTFPFQTRVAIIITKDTVYRSNQYAVLRVVSGSNKTKCEMETNI